MFSDITKPDIIQFGRLADLVSGFKSFYPFPIVIIWPNGAQKQRKLVDMWGKPITRNAKWPDTRTVGYFADVILGRAWAFRKAPQSPYSYSRGETVPASDRVDMRPNPNTSLYDNTDNKILCYTIEREISRHNAK